MTLDPFPGPVDESGRLGVNRFVIQDTLKVGGHVDGGRVSTFVILRHRLQDDCGKIAGDGGVEFAWCDWLFVGNSLRQPGNIRVGKCRLQREHLVERRP